MAIVDFIGEQDVTLARTLAAARLAVAGIDIADWDHILLVGSGSSFNALAIVAPGLRQALRAQVTVINPAVLLGEIDLVLGQPLVVVLSQTGTSTTSIDVAAACKARGWQTLLVTADPQSPIARLGLATVPVVIGAEPIGPKTKGFTASIMACLVLAEKLSGRDLPAYSGQNLHALLVSAAGDSKRLLDNAGIPDYVVISGSGRFHGVALEASLKLSEIAGLASAAFEPEELLHGRLHGMNARSLGMMIVADEAERAIAARTAAVMAERGVRIVVLNLTDQPTPWDWYALAGNQVAPLDAIAASIPFQWLAVELALRRGMVPDDMTYPGLSKALSIKTYAQ